MRSVTADWKLVRDHRDRPLLELTLADVYTNNQATEEFAPAELQDETNLGNRLHRLWGRLLHARSDDLIKQLREIAIQAEGD
jgi:hypothetical protein